MRTKSEKLYEDKPGLIIIKTPEDEFIYIMRATKSVNESFKSLKRNIKYGSNNGSQIELYDYLQNNEYKVQVKYLAAEEVNQMARDYIYSFVPKFNSKKNYDNLDTSNWREYMNNYYKINKNQRLKKNKRDREYYYTHKEYFREYQRKRNAKNK